MMKLLLKIIVCLIFTLSFFACKKPKEGYWQATFTSEDGITTGFECGIVENDTAIFIEHKEAHSYNDQVSGRLTKKSKKKAEGNIEKTITVQQEVLAQEYFIK